MKRIFYGKKRLFRVLVIALLPLSMGVSALTYGFSGGVTGHLWSGEVWARWTSKNDPKINNNVVVYASGSHVTKAYANRWASAYTSTGRKPSGNRAYWEYY
ncbi:MAG: 4a-hydroxytetrahydrobiopterin dehydratase [Streptococcus dysgalactiae]|nr:4a-hydroxytetrahydrobiopterin dehydratase [Streptococcus dysgalactiae]